ncbi:SDR family oxidoreductase [Dactylosporangium darangshiense]|uniref:SDR family oxidoreductase n=1 Tax=Dactylosporangium darangshiense TaxID=579108 RepID=UPI0031EA9D2E
MTTNTAAGKVSLVTGANKGIGLEIARQLSRLGHTALIGARDATRGQAAVRQLQAEGLDAVFLPLDVTDQPSIDAAAHAVEERFGRLDVLVNNAAVAMDDAPPSGLDVAILRRTYETNVFGVFAVIRAMLPLLYKADAGRIVNMSSGAGSLTLVSGPDWRPEWNTLAYNSSKSAVNAITVHFAAELRSTPIKVNAVNPGYVRTDMSPEGDRTVEQGAIAPVRLATLPADGPTGGFFDENGIVAW